MDVREKCFSIKMNQFLPSEGRRVCLFWTNQNMLSKLFDKLNANDIRIYFHSYRRVNLKFQLLNQEILQEAQSVAVGRDFD